MMLVVQCLVLLAACSIPGVEGQNMEKMQSGGQMRLLHTGMDVDGDESVSLDEGSALVQSICIMPMYHQSASIMQNMDTNKDEQLSLDEFTEDLKKLAKVTEEQKLDYTNRFASFDEDGDKVLNMYEVLPLFNYMFHFKKIDNNNDGVITGKEFQQVRRNMEHLRQEEIDESLVKSKTIFKELDENGDRGLDAHEHFVFQSGCYASLKAWIGLFELADSNKDGHATADDFAAVREHAEFPGSAAYYHSRQWIKTLEDFSQLEQEEASIEDQARRKPEL